MEYASTTNKGKQMFLVWLTRVIVGIILLVIMSVIDAFLLVTYAGNITQIPFLGTLTFGTWFWLNILTTLPISTAVGVSNAMKELD